MLSFSVLYLYQETIFLYMFNILANLRVCLWIFLEHLRVMGVVVWIYSFLAKAPAPACIPDCGGVFAGGPCLHTLPRCHTTSLGSRADSCAFLSSTAWPTPRRQQIQRGPAAPSPSALTRCH